MSGPIFEARFHSTCSNCGGNIAKGMDVKWEDGNVVHDDCEGYDFNMRETVRGYTSTTVDVTPLQRPTCPRCFLELPVSGVCEECS